MTEVTASRNTPRTQISVTGAPPRPVQTH
jgi:hypothetical protein